MLRANALLEVIGSEPLMLIAALPKPQLVPATMDAALGASIWSWEVGCEARIWNCAWIVSWEAGCGAGSLDCELGGGMRRWGCAGALSVIVVFYDRKCRTFYFRASGVVARRLA